MIITIDGPAGTGKTTIARSVAAKLKFRYFDTGAMYRALTYKILTGRVDLQDQKALELLLSGFHFDIREDEGHKRYFVDGEDVTEQIRSREVTQKVSEVSAIGAVRKAIVAIQREFGAGKNAVFEGRDMGTVVFPHAEVKIFLTARPEVRAKRRYLELQQKGGTSLTEPEVLQEIIERDHFDSTRALSPLKQAENAHLVDTSDLSVEQVIQQILAYIPPAS